MRRKAKFISAPVKKIQNNNLDQILYGFVFILFTLTIIYIFTIWNLSFHSDSAAANILAREQIRTGKIFPETWHTSTGLFIFFYNSLIVPFSIFTNNQIMLRDIAVAVVLTLFVILFYFFSKKIFKSKFSLIYLCLFFSGTSSMVIDIAFAQGAYLISLLDGIIILTLFLASITEEWKIKNMRNYVFLLFYMVYQSLYGPLNLAYQIIPLFGAAFLYFIIENWKSPFNEICQQLARGGKVFAALIFSVFTGLAGYCKLASYVDFNSGVNIVYPGIAENVDKFLRFVLNAIGFRSGVELFSIPGLMNVVIIVAFVSAVLCCVLLFRRYQEQPFAVKILMLYSLIICVIFLFFDFFVYCQTDGTERYFFKPLIFIWILASYYLYTYFFTQGVMAKTIGIIVIAVFSLPNMLLVIPQVFHYSQDRREQLGLVNYLKENDLKYGYATFWNAGNNMVLSDFEIEIGGISLTDPISPYLWLSSDISYDPSQHNGDSFLLLTQDECDWFCNSAALQRLGEPKEVLTYGNYIIYVFPYNISENEFKGSGYKNTELIRNMCVSDTSMIMDSGGLSVTAGQVIYGPYMPLESGKYKIDFDFTEILGDVTLRLTSDSGANILLERSLETEEKQVIIELSEAVENFEIVLTTDGSAAISSIKISSVS